MEKFPVGSEIEGEIKNITEFGLFIGLPGDIDGMAHLSDLTWNKTGEEALADFKKGDMVKAKILVVDLEKERVSLGIKQLSDDPFSSGTADLKKGDVVTCTITKVVDNGLEVATSDGVSGFIRKVELSRERSEQRPDRFAAGEKIDAKVIQIDRSGRKLTLSVKALEVEEEKKAMKEYGSSDSGASLGDILGVALARREAALGKDGTEADEKPAKKPAKKAAAKKTAKQADSNDAQAPAEEAAAEPAAKAKKAPAKKKAEAGK